MHFCKQSLGNISQYLGQFFKTLHTVLIFQLDTVVTLKKILLGFGVVNKIISCFLHFHYSYIPSPSLYYSESEQCLTTT